MRASIWLFFHGSAICSQHNAASYNSIIRKLFVERLGAASYYLQKAPYAHRLFIETTKRALGKTLPSAKLANFIEGR